jgi:hypothetical protein
MSPACESIRVRGLFEWMLVRKEGAGQGDGADQVQVYKGSWKASDLPWASFIWTALRLSIFLIFNCVPSLALFLPPSLRRTHLPTQPHSPSPSPSSILLHCPNLVSYILSLSSFRPVSPLPHPPPRPIPRQPSLSLPLVYARQLSFLPVKDRRKASTTERTSANAPVFLEHPRFTFANSPSLSLSLSLSLCLSLSIDICEKTCDSPLSLSKDCIISVLIGNVTSAR